MEDNLCPICFDIIDDNEFKLDCNHGFHDKCIIKWFRTTNAQGKCPCCNDSPHNDHNNTESVQPFQIYRIDQLLISERCAAIKRYSKKSTAPEQLKKNFEKLNKLEKELKEITIEQKKFIKEHKETIKYGKSLDTKRWKKDLLIKKRKYNIICSFSNTTFQGLLL
jgi:uncharacterized protein (UPF0335 family)